MSALVMYVSLSACMMSGSLDVSMWLQGVRRYVNTLSIKTIRGGMAVIVLCVLGVKSIISYTVYYWVMCSVLYSAFCLEFTDFLEELTKNRACTLAVISHVTTEKTFVN